MFKSIESREQIVEMVNARVGLEQDEIELTKNTLLNKALSYRLGFSPPPASPWPLLLQPQLPAGAPHSSSPPPPLPPPLTAEDDVLMDHDDDEEDDDDDHSRGKRPQDSVVAVVPRRLSDDGSRKRSRPKSAKASAFRDPHRLSGGHPAGVVKRVNFSSAPPDVIPAAAAGAASAATTPAAETTSSNHVLFDSQQQQQQQRSPHQALHAGGADEDQEMETTTTTTEAYEPHATSSAPAVGSPASPAANGTE